MKLRNTNLEKPSGLALLSASIQKSVNNRIMGAKAIISSLSEPSASVRLEANRSVSGLAIEESRTPQTGEKNCFCFEVVIPIPEAIAFSIRRDEFALALARDVVSTHNPLLFLDDSMNRFPCRSAFDCAEQIRRDLKKVAPKRPVQTIIVDDKEPVIPLDAWIKCAGVAIAERFEDNGADHETMDDALPTSVDLRLFVEVEVVLDGMVSNSNLVDVCQLLKTRLRESLHGIIMRAEFIVSRSELKQI